MWGFRGLWIWVVRGLGFRAYGLGASGLLFCLKVWGVGLGLGFQGASRFKGTLRQTVPFWNLSHSPPFKRLWSSKSHVKLSMLVKKFSMLLKERSSGILDPNSKRPPPSSSPPPVPQ